jgi:hypothetical protein
MVADPMPPPPHEDPRLTKELQARRPQQRAALRETMEHLFPDDVDARVATLRVRNAHGKRAIACEADAVMFAQAYLGGTLDLAGTLERLTLCADVTALALSDPGDAASVGRALQRTHDMLWPAEYGVYSSDRCLICKNKSVYHAPAQVAHADEETSFITVCTFCNGNA